MKRKQNKSGLTLVEILVVISIIALLAAGLYSVGNYVETQAKVKLAESTIETLCCALEQYRDFYDGVTGVGKFPDPDANAPSLPTTPPGPNEVPAGCSLNIEKLYYRLSCAPDAKKIIGQINPSLIKDKNKNNFPEIVDPWQNYFHYSYVTGDNFPVIDSNGPNRISGDDDDISSK
jgi:prepilin-type N-terminal cleavage/methylation domain-containing protein